MTADLSHRRRTDYGEFRGDDYWRSEPLCQTFQPESQVDSRTDCREVEPILCSYIAEEDLAQVKANSE